MCREVGIPPKRGPRDQDLGCKRFVWGGDQWQSETGKGRKPMQGAFKSRLQLQTREFNPTGVSQRQWGNTAATSPTRRARKLGSSLCSSRMALAQGCVCVGPPSTAVRGRKRSDRKSRYLPCGDGARQGMRAGHCQHLCGGEVRGARQE